jgi:SET domain-containing protein
LKKIFTREEKGLFAKTDIPQGTRIGEYEGWLVTPRTLGDNDTKYVLWLPHQDKESPRKGILGENRLRFANHSRHEFNMAPVFELERAFFHAVRDIRQDEELTFKYGNIDF